jgi:hypothetical protein
MDAEFLSKAFQRITQYILGMTSTALRKGVNTLTHAAKHPLANVWGLGASYAISAFKSYTDYKFEEDRLKNFFEPELAAKAGKTSGLATIQDLHSAAQENPILEQAIKRNKTIGWLSFGSGSIAVTGAVLATMAVFGAPFIAPTMAVVSVASVVMGLAIGMAVGLPVFMAVEKLAMSTGKKMLGLTEPTLYEQLRDIERMQARHQDISQSHVFSLFCNANPSIAAQVESAYGAPYATLPDDKKRHALINLGPEINLEATTEKLNDGKIIRGQELAFLAFGDRSGVPELDAPHRTVIERLHTELAKTQEHVGALQAKAREHAANMAEAAKQKAALLADKAKEKWPFKRGDVSAVVPEDQQKAQDAIALSQAANSNLESQGKHTARYINGLNQGTGLGSALPV